MPDRTTDLASYWYHQCPIKRASPDLAGFIRPSNKYSVTPGASTSQFLFGWLRNISQVIHETHQETPALGLGGPQDG